MTMANLVVIEDNAIERTLIAAAVECTDLPINVRVVNDLPDIDPLIGWADVFLIDLCLPHSTGLDSIVSLVKRLKGTPIPIVAFSAKTISKRAAIESGADDFIDKAAVEKDRATLFRVALRHFYRYLPQSITRLGVSIGG
jgi:CheY-like chemotaxis protein